MLFEIIHVILIWSVPTLFAITVHEAAHGLVAKWFNDPTAWQYGRITLNPVPHIDIIGTILFPLLSLMTGGLMFGWAKPVPIIPRNLKPRKYAMIFVALAGPFSNIIMAILWAFLMIQHPVFGSNIAWFELAQAGVIVNLSLATINLLPFPPLDGGKVLIELLPYSKRWLLDLLDQYGLMILIVMMFTGILGVILSPIFNTLALIVKLIVGIR
ncbi:MAG: site-2 protease family protein [Legionellales bacterium]|nr:site-2 protease family protein [Legionellales bacterium]|tara:strand:- start:3398 stop:4036 length:639 start_codon:yes stop_codon:yes gene_type:complete